MTNLADIRSELTYGIEWGPVQDGELDKGDPIYIVRRTPYKLCFRALKIDGSLNFPLESVMELPLAPMKSVPAS